jgi:uncharacterized protein YuzE
MRITQEEDILFIEFREGVVARVEEPLEDIHVELDADGEVLTIEVIGNASAAELMEIFQRFGLDHKLVFAKAS